MNEKTLNRIGMVIISIAILIFNLIIGANEKELRILPISIILLISIIYLIARKIILKQKIVIKNKIDILVLIFMLSTLLPYVFKTYCTYQGTVEFILKYFFIYAIYLVARNTIDSKNKINIIIDITIISSLIIAILGIDIQHNQILNWIIIKLNLRYTECDVFSSTFGYANTAAAYFSFCIFLAIHQIQNKKQKIVKILYLLYIILAIYIILETASRTIFVLLGIGVVIYFFLYYLPSIMQKKKKTIKIALVILTIIIMFMIFLYTIGINVSKPYVFTNITYQRNFKYNFEPNQNYTIELELNIENICEDYGKDIKVEIIEINQYYNQKILAEKNVEIEEKKVDLNFTTTDALYQIDMLIINEGKEKISIEKCYINRK